MKRFLSSPIAIYTLSPFLGPILGPLIAGFINQNISWRWTYYVQVIWAGIEVILLILVRTLFFFLMLIG